MAFRIYQWNLEKAGIDVTHLRLIHGSKYYGNSFKVVFVGESGGYASAPGTGFGGSIGWTKRKAYDALGYMSRLMEDLRYAETEIEKFAHEGEIVGNQSMYVHVRDEQWNGDVKIYRHVTTNEGIVVSRAFTFDRGDETMIFTYDLELNEVSDWGELYAGYGVTHEEALQSFEDRQSEK